MQFTKILTKREANKAQIDSLFTPGGTLGPGTIRYDKGKYARNVTGARYLTPTETPIWCEKRKDKDGPYWALFTFRKG